MSSPPGHALTSAESSKRGCLEGAQQQLQMLDKLLAVSCYCSLRREPLSEPRTDDASTLGVTTRRKPSG